jgi:hypothetical protein
MKSRLKYAGLGAALATAATSLQAEVKINDTFSVSGYAVAAGTMTDPDSGKNNYTLADSGASNLDSAKFAVTGAKDALSGKVSLFYVPQAPSSVGTAGILDAYATYTAGDVSVTAGKYLSYLGYEAFDPINMAQLTYATTIFAIPAYHTGAKVDYVGEGFSLGFSATDSLFSGDGFFQGDGEVSDDVGYEAIATYTGIEKLTVFAGIGYEDTDGAPDDTFVFDLWASYALSDTVTIAGEYDYMDDAAQAALAFLQYKFCDKVSAVARVSVMDIDGGDTGSYFTVAPTYTFTENWSLRGEISYADSAEGGFTSIGDKGFFYGVQGVFKF